MPTATQQKVSGGPTHAIAGALALAGSSSGVANRPYGGSFRELGDWMKAQEATTRLVLPRRSYTIVRLDGKAFHTYTRGLERPFDAKLTEDMACVTKFLCEEVEGAAIGYTQSDEISLLLCDFAKPGTEAYFGGNVQKLTSILASMVTAKFAERRPGKLALFDARAFCLPRDAVGSYFAWRRADAKRNAVAMAAQARFSARQLHGASTRRQLELLGEAGVDFDAYPPQFRYGTLLVRTIVTGDVTYTHKGTGELCVAKDVTRKVWQPVAADGPAFGGLEELIPRREED